MRIVMLPFSLRLCQVHSALRHFAHDPRALPRLKSWLSLCEHVWTSAPRTIQLLKHSIVNGQLVTPNLKGSQGRIVTNSWERIRAFLPIATVPGSPTGVSAVAGNQQATVTFTPPANNGG